MRVVIVGRNYSSLLGMIRAVGMAKHPITVVRVNKMLTDKKVSDNFSIIRSSKYVSEYYSALQDRESLLDVLLSKCAKKGEMQVVLPTDDFAASTIDLNYQKLKEYFLMPNIQDTQGEIVRMMDKTLQKSIAAQVGLNVAKGWHIDIKDGKYSIPETIEYPVFTKPEISIQLNKKCMRRCDNRQDLTAVLDEVAAQADCTILAEEFMEIGKEYAVVGVSAGNCSVIPGIITVESMGSGAHRGVTLKGSYSGFAQFGNLKHLLKEYIEHIHLTGLFDVDLYESNGKIYFGELNLRMGASGFASICAGVNLPGMLIDYLTDQKQPNDIDYDGAFLFLNEKVNLDDFANGFISWWQFRENERITDYKFIKDDNDPKPYRAYKAFVAKARLLSLVRKIRK